MIQLAITLRDMAEKVVARSTFAGPLQLSLGIAIHAGPVVIAALRTDNLIRCDILGETAKTTYGLLSTVRPGRISCTEFFANILQACSTLSKSYRSTAHCNFNTISTQHNRQPPTICCLVTHKARAV